MSGVVHPTEHRGVGVGVLHYPLTHVIEVLGLETGDQLLEALVSEIDEDTGVNLTGG